MSGAPSRRVTAPLRAILRYGRRIASYGKSILRRPAHLLRDTIRNQHPGLFQALLKNPLTRQIYYGFTRPSIAGHSLQQMPQLSNNDHIKQDLISAVALQESLIQAAARWRLGKRIDV